MASQKKNSVPSPDVIPAPRASRQGTRASLRFTCSEDLARKTCALLDKVERAEDPEGHREALADAVVALTGQGLDAYFLEPLKKAKAGFVAQQSAALGLAGTRQVMGSVIRNIITRMDGPQLISVCGSIREFMR